MMFLDVIIGGMQDHQSVKTNGICTCLTSSMGTGGGYVPMIVLVINDEKYSKSFRNIP